LQYLDLCMSGRYNKKEMTRMLVGQGGLYAYTGSTDMQIIEQAAENHPEYREVLEAMAYQIAKSIAALTAVLGGLPDAVVLTGGLARSDWLISQVTSRVAFLGHVLVFPGENEMEALAAGALHAIRGELPCLDYIPEP
jgi:butyrate kinase